MELRTMVVSDGESKAVRSENFSFLSFEDRLLSVWRAKIPVAAFAIVAALAGYSAERYLLRTYETSVVVRPQVSSAFVEFSSLLQGTAGSWHNIESASESAYDLFIRNAHNSETREAALAANRSMFPDAAREDSSAVSRLAGMFSVVVGDGKINLSGKTTTISIRYKKDWRPAPLLNQYAAELIAGTARSMIDSGRSGLEALRGGYQRDLARLRAVRDVAAKQAALTYSEALSTAIAAGIDGPITTNLGTTAAVVAGNSQVPLYYYGRNILQHEIKNIESHVGNDLSIPEFASLQASIKDVEARLAALAQVKLQPVVVSEPASDSGRIVSPSPIGIVLLCLGIGGICGYLWATIYRRQKLAAS
jgi:LPS O-antigen subunit length determinant protein (WzzB/FepE family)